MRTRTRIKLLAPAKLRRSTPFAAQLRLLFAFCRVSRERVERIAELVDLKKPKSRNDLNQSIGRTTRLITRGSCSTQLFGSLNWFIAMFVADSNIHFIDAPVHAERPLAQEKTAAGAGDISAGYRWIVTWSMTNPCMATTPSLRSAVRSAVTPRGRERTPVSPRPEGASASKFAKHIGQLALGHRACTFAMKTALRSDRMRQIGRSMQ